MKALGAEPLQPNDAWLVATYCSRADGHTSSQGVTTANSENPHGKGEDNNSKT